MFAAQHLVCARHPPREYPESKPRQPFPARREAKKQSHEGKAARRVSRGKTFAFFDLDEIGGI